MRIERVRVGAFGKLYDLDSGSEPLGGLVVALGPNEAGKSTLFHFLTTALYGFHPANREGNPYTPWGAEEASGEIHLRLDSGECATIERRLRSAPSGVLTLGGHGEELRNRALPWVGHVPLAVFRQVFAVTLSDLAGLDDDTWAKIQDRILGSMGATDLQPARVVAETLEKEAGELWRPHRRGNQRIRDLQEEIRSLRTQRREAMGRDSEIRTLVARLGETEQSLAAARQEREEARVHVERMEKLVPVRASLMRIAALREEAGSRADLEGLPDDPAALISELRERRVALQDDLDEVESDSKEPAEIRSGFDVRARRAVEHREAIETLIARSAAQSERHRAAMLVRRLEETRGTLAASSSGLFTESWDSVPAGALAAIPVESLRERLRTLEAARAERGLLQGRLERTNTEPVRPTDWRLPAAIVLTGVILAVVGATTGPQLLQLAGVPAIAVGTTLGLLAVRRGSGGPSEAETLRAEIANATAREESSMAAVGDLLRGLPIATDRLGAPDDRLVADLEACRRTAREHAEQHSELDALRRRISVVDREIEACAAGVGLSADGGPEATMAALERTLREGLRRREAARGAERELARLKRSRDRITAESRSVESRIGGLSERLAAIGGGSVEQGLEIARQRMEAHRLADQLEQELQRRHPDLDDLVARIQDAEHADRGWTVDERELAALRNRIEELSEEIEELGRTAEALGRDVEYLRDGRTVDAVDGQIGAHEEEEQRLVRERDRRWILAQLLREADRTFREEHQPDLIRRAGRYLDHLTDGRYDRILVDETATGDLFQVMGPGLAAPIPLSPPISTGTLEQAYLSLRLAIVDHLDQGGEQLPLFIDEAFVNWDRARRDRGVEVLQSVARGRQVFFFTCHPEVAAELTGRGGRLLQLQRDA